MFFWSPHVSIKRYDAGTARFDYYGGRNRSKSLSLPDSLAPPTLWELKIIIGQDTCGEFPYRDKALSGMIG